MTDWWKDPPVNRDAARTALTDAREQLEAQRIHLVFLCDLCRLLADRLVPPRACDEPAERRVLGWLLSERCRSADFADLDAYDFAGAAHRLAFAVGLELIAMWEHGELPPTVWPDRASVITAAWLSTSAERAAAVEDAVWRLPYVTTLPQREIDLVASLGRGWSVVDQSFNIAPYEAR
jgi:hypothetical protein